MIHIIYMAAGNSRRFGSNKLLYEWKGKPLYRHGLDTVVEATEIFRRRELEKISITVVTRYPEIMEYVESLKHVISLEHAKSQDSPEIWVVNSPLSEKGASYTIKAGLEAVLEKNFSMHDRFLFMVADQPGLQVSTLLRLIEASENKPLTSLMYGRKPANPCVFSSCYLPDLMALEGDKGGRSIMKREENNGRKVIYVEAGCEEVWDMDVLPED